jgi:uncharacterized membrane protein YdjX (TVP38/TMEM64 family)
VIAIDGQWSDQLLFFLSIVQSSGWLAPIVFILVHLLRQFLFIPVALVCMAGGILFGSLFGTLFSLIGLTFVSIIFYLVVRHMPTTVNRLFRMKEKWFGRHAQLTVGQVAVLRLIPFIHYHLLNGCLYERKKDFHSFVMSSFLANIPLAVFYTVFGQYIRQFSLTMMALLFISFFVLFIALREKVRVWTLKEFLESSSS